MSRTGSNAIKNNWFICNMWLKWFKSRNNTIRLKLWRTKWINRTTCDAISNHLLQFSNQMIWYNKVFTLVTWVTYQGPMHIMDNNKCSGYYFYESGRPSSILSGWVPISITVAHRHRACLRRNRLGVWVLVVSDTYPMFIEPTITWAPRGSLAMRLNHCTGLNRAILPAG
jgi:hypothetical protein